MDMEIEVTSIEVIKPSSPTPCNLRIFKLSLFDQMMPPFFYVPIIFFYKPESDNNLKIDQILTQLKNSLSETLSEFYPLAGRIKDHLSIDCNDEGVLFSEAKVVNFHLHEFFKQRKIDLLHKLLPCRTVCIKPADTLVQVAVRLNVFACGGIAIGLCFSHKIIDGATMSAFLRRWAAIASGHCVKKVHPHHDMAAKIFPPRESVPNDMSFLFSEFIKEGNGITQRFVFDSAALLALKAKAASQLAPNPTRIEVVSCFIWKCAMAASKSLLGSHQKPSVITHSVNLRHRVVPPMSENTIGNIFCKAIARHDSIPGEAIIEFHCLVKLLRQAMAEVDDNHLQRLQGNEGFQEIFKIIEKVKEMSLKEKLEAYAFTSWCKMGFNELDFGWGKPVWVSYIGCNMSPMFMNVVILIDSILGDGIEAWVTLDEHEMAILEADPEFLEFASLNPTIQIL